MNKSKAEIIQIYQGLLNYFYSGVLAFVVLNTIREEYQTTQEGREDIFISTIYFSTYNTAVLVLANTVKPNQQSVNLSYLFNCITTSKDEFAIGAYNKLIIYIPQFQAELNRIDHTIISAIQLRDKSVAHLDRKNIIDPAYLIQDQPVIWDDIKLAYNIIGSGLLEIGKLLGLSDIEPYATIANIQLVQRTVQIFRLLYGLDKGNIRISESNQ